MIEKYERLKTIAATYGYDKVEEWTTYDNKDTVKVKLKNGKQYLGHSSDIVLYND